MLVAAMMAHRAVYCKGAGRNPKSSMVEELQMPQRGPRGVRDVPAEQFIRAYAEHLKANDKVGTQKLG